MSRRPALKGCASTTSMIVVLTSREGEEGAVSYHAPYAWPATANGVLDVPGYVELLHAAGHDDEAGRVEVAWM